MSAYIAVCQLRSDNSRRRGITTMYDSRLISKEAVYISRQRKTGSRKTKQIHLTQNAGVRR